MMEAEETEKEIEARSNEYRPVAKRASLLYFCLADLAVVSYCSYAFRNCFSCPSRQSRDLRISARINLQAAGIQPHVK